MRVTWLNSEEDMQWLLSTHLKGYKLGWIKPESAALYGNEDSPTTIELYPVRQPTLDMKPFSLSLQHGVYTPDGWTPEGFAPPSSDQ